MPVLRDNLSLSPFPRTKDCDHDLEKSNDCQNESNRTLNTYIEVNDSLIDELEDRNDKILDLQSSYQPKSATGPMLLAIAMMPDEAMRTSPVVRSSESTTKGDIGSDMAGLRQNSGFSESIKQQALRNIVEDDQSWDEIKRRLQEAQTVTSVHVKEVCGSFVQRKAEKIKEERKANESTFRKLRNLFKGK
mmetsp:Transcript_9583/g.11119  ORF Transcript_9583/g.11119 Transcript_9583/m.11119 type:complete len:190 (+) Transcript_9583:112-681(+)